MLELIVRFEHSVPKGGFSWALQASTGSLGCLNINFI